jgi:hypothetical protein
MTQKTRAKFEALWASYMEARDALAASSAPDLPATADGFARFVMEAEGDRALKSHLGLVNEARKALRRLVKHVHKHGQTVIADQAEAGSAPARKAGPARKRRVTSLEASVRMPVGPRGRKAAPPAAAPAMAKAARPAGGQAKTAATPRPRRSPAAKAAEPAAPAKQPKEVKGAKAAAEPAAKRPARAPAARALSRRPAKAPTKTP